MRLYTRHDRWVAAKPDNPATLLGRGFAWRAWGEAMATLVRAFTAATGDNWGTSDDARDGGGLMDKDDSPAPRVQVGIMPDVGGGPVPRFDHVAAQVRAAEQVGFDSFWLSDHLLFRFPPRETGRWEVMTMLGALAAITHRIRLGPLVACTAFRPPALLAKIADTLDEVSAGRLILGLGAGWHEPEFRAFGYPFDHRVSRFAEALEIVVPLLRKGQVDFVGEYVEAHDAQLVPRGPSRSGPPIWIAGKGPRMLRLAARYADAWNTAWHSDTSRGRAGTGGPAADLRGSRPGPRHPGRDGRHIRSRSRTR